LNLRDNVRSIDDMLPITHTCFFSIELPAYTTLDVMTERVIFAMVNCTAIDGDGNNDQGTVDVNVDDDDSF